jgi:hypothetical protein
MLGFMPKSLPGHELLPPWSLLGTDVQQQGTDWIVMADEPAQPACPTCGRSTSRHSACVRTL